MKFYLQAECPNCQSEMFKLVATMIERNGHPVVPLDMGAQESWECDGCGITSCTGDIDLMVLSTSSKQ